MACRDFSSSVLGRCVNTGAQNLHGSLLGCVLTPTDTALLGNRIRVLQGRVCSPLERNWSLPCPVSLLLLGKSLQSAAIRRFSEFSLNTSVSRARSIVVGLHFPGFSVLNLDYVT